MRHELIDIVGRESGKAGLVVGLGPSVNENLDLIKEVDSKDDEWSIVSCNSIDRLMPDLSHDYWILAQPATEENEQCLCHDEMIQRIIDKNAFWIYTDNLDRTPREEVDKKLKSVNFAGYDQHHFRGAGENGQCGAPGPCCDRNKEIPNRISIQDLLKAACGSDHELPHGSYGGGDTVSVHMLALSVILGLNPIYATGIDLDYSGGYFNNEVQFKHGHGLSINQDRKMMGIISINNDQVMTSRVLRDIKIIARMAEKIGTKIYALDQSPGRLHESLPVQRP